MHWTECIQTTVPKLWPEMNKTCSKHALQGKLLALYRRGMIGGIISFQGFINSTIKGCEIFVNVELFTRYIDTSGVRLLRWKLWRCNEKTYWQTERNVHRKTSLICSSKKLRKRPESRQKTHLVDIRRLWFHSNFFAQEIMQWPLFLLKLLINNYDRS